MLFDFQKFIKDLRENNEKKEMVIKYESLVEPLKGQIEDQVWYKEYIKLYKTRQYSKPEEIEKDFDWMLLLQLAASSFSTDALLETSGSSVEMIFSVQSGDQLVVKKATELWGFQVLRLYEIYAEEQMNLQILMKEDEKEKEAILAQREARMKRWNNVLNIFEKKQIVTETIMELEKIGIMQ